MKPTDYLLPVYVQKVPTRDPYAINAGKKAHDWLIYKGGPGGNSDKVFVSWDSRLARSLNHGKKIIAINCCRWRVIRINPPKP